MNRLCTKYKQEIHIKKVFRKKLKKELRKVPKKMSKKNPRSKRQFALCVSFEL